MSYHEDIVELFNRTYEVDRDKYIKKWMVSWNYQNKRGNKSIHSYNGPEDLIKWFEWQTKSEKPDYFDDDEIIPLIDVSKKADFRILEKFHLEFDEEKYEKYIGRYNAQDYLYQNFYQIPERYRVYNILDFGAGYGRQANIWMQKRKDIIYVGMDAIPLSYCLQHFYYSQLSSYLSIPFYEYIYG